MTLTPEQHAAFEAAAKPLIAWVCANCHPHVSVVVTPTTAELLEGVSSVSTTEFLRD